MLPVPKIQPRFAGRPTRSLVAIPTELSLLKMVLSSKNIAVFVLSYEGG
jgi:hypothetical protein